MWKSFSRVENFLKRTKVPQVSKGLSTEEKFPKPGKVSQAE